MSLVRRRGISFSFEHMAQVPTAITAYDLYPFHAECAICVSRHSSWNRIEEGGPSTARLELVVGLVERGVASSAGICTFVWVVLVVFAGEWCFCAFLSKDAKLFYGHTRVSTTLMDIKRAEPYLD